MSPLDVAGTRNSCGYAQRGSACSLRGFFYLIGAAAVLFSPPRSQLRLYTSVSIRSARRTFPCPSTSIEREIPGAGALIARANFRPSRKNPAASCSNLGPEIQWVHSYVTDNKIYCVYIAPNEEMVREHASQGGFPANSVSEVKSMIDPTTAEAR